MWTRFICGRDQITARQKGGQTGIAPAEARPGTGATSRDRTVHVAATSRAWTRPGFAKRAGFSLIARLARRRKDLPDRMFAGFLRLVVRECRGDRNHLRKAANWALRGTGMRGPF